MHALKKDYRDGGTPFPYATECTSSGDACDVAALVAEMDFADVAEPVFLGLDDDTADSDAVELVKLFPALFTISRIFSPVEICMARRRFPIELVGISLSYSFPRIPSEIHIFYDGFSIDMRWRYY